MTLWIRSPRRVTIGATLMAASAFGLTVGSSLATGAPTKAHAHAAKSTVGSDIGALDVTATSSAVSLPVYSHQGEDVEADIPYSLSTLGTGGIGNALTSVLWPGSTGAHGGDTLNLLGLPIPANIGQMLNDPEVAHAQTGVGDTTVDNSHPGLVMSSHATPLNVSAQSNVGGKSIPVLGSIIGTTGAKTSIKVTGASTVTSKAVSTIHNITVAKVIKIGSITSTAKAVSDGHHVARSSAKTVVANVTIAGIAVKLDQSGLHIPNSSLPLVGSTATTVINTALKSAGIHIDVTKTTHKAHGQHVSASAGAVTLKLGNSQYKNQANDTGTLVVLGGASIDQIVHHGFKQPVIKPTKTPKPTNSKAPTSNGSPQSNGSTNIPPVDNVPSGPTSQTGPISAAPPSVFSSNPVSLPSSLKPGWFIVALIGAGLFAIGMKRLPDQVLQNAGSTCSLEE
jgi:hypothetical protein